MDDKVEIKMGGGGVNHMYNFFNKFFYYKTLFICVKQLIKTLKINIFFAGLG
jgi:hypothetical protein